MSGQSSNLPKRWSISILKTPSLLSLRSQTGILCLLHFICASTVCVSGFIGAVLTELLWQHRVSLTAPDTGPLRRWISPPLEMSAPRAFPIQCCLSENKDPPVWRASVAQSLKLQEAPLRAKKGKTNPLSPNLSPHTGIPQSYSASLQVHKQSTINKEVRTRHYNLAKVSSGSDLSIQHPDAT